MTRDAAQRRAPIATMDCERVEQDDACRPRGERFGAAGSTCDRRGHQARQSRESAGDAAAVMLVLSPPLHALCNALGAARTSALGCVGPAPNFSSRPPAPRCVISPGLNFENSLAGAAAVVATRGPRFVFELQWTTSLSVCGSERQIPALGMPIVAQRTSSERERAVRRSRYLVGTAYENR